MIVIARRWSGSRARAPGRRASLTRSRRCWARSRIVASSCCARRRCASVCTISSTRSCPGLSAPAGHGRALSLDTPTGRAVLACAVDFAGRPPTPTIAHGRAPRTPDRRDRGVLGCALEELLAPPADAKLRAARLARDVHRLQDSAGRHRRRRRASSSELLADSAGQILTTLPGVATVRAAAFTAHSLPIERFPTPEHLYSATGLAPASYQSATVAQTRRDQPHRPARAPRRADGHRLGPGRSTRPPSRRRDAELRARGMTGRSKHGSRSPATPAGSAGDCFTPNSPTTIGVTIAPGETAGGDGASAMPHDGAT